MPVRAPGRAPVGFICTWRRLTRLACQRSRVPSLPLLARDLILRQYLLGAARNAACRLDRSSRKFALKSRAPPHIAFHNFVFGVKGTTTEKPKVI